jgi:pimeloyl-ACP methyl ester carboxylesterase
MSKYTSNFLARYQSSYCEVGSVRCHYVKIGQGPSIILIHGGGTWSYTWRYNLDELAKHFTVYAVDMPGFGLTTVEDRFMPTEDYFADFLHSFLDKLNLGKVSMVGSSWGGGWVLRFMERYPNEVNRSVVIDSAGIYYHKVKRPTFLWNLVNVPGLGRLLTRYFVAPMFMRMQYRSLFVDRSSVTSEVGRELAFGLRRIDNRRILYEFGFRDMWGKTDRDLSNITAPVLIIWGKEDPLLSVADADRMQARIPNSRVLVIPHTGHLPQEEHPEIVNEAMIEFLSVE